MRWATAACVSAALLACSAASVAPNPEPAAFLDSRAAPLFEFHSNFWVNLHQTLFHEALLSTGKPDRRLQSTTPLSTAEMSKQEKADWNSAVAFYAQTFGSRRELFDEEMVRINGELAAQPDDGAALNKAGLPPKLTAILQRATPVYHKYWWPTHDASNKNWIGSQLAPVNELGAQIAAAIEKDLHQPWPSAPVRVDVCYYVPEIGHAYTTDNPPHTIFSSSAPGVQGLNGFKTLFHEASHSFSDTMSNALFAECGAQKNEVRRFVARRAVLHAGSRGSPRPAAGRTEELQTLCLPVRTLFARRLAKVPRRAGKRLAAVSRRQNRFHLSHSFHGRGLA